MPKQSQKYKQFDCFSSHESKSSYFLVHRKKNGKKGGRPAKCAEEAVAHAAHAVPAAAPDPVEEGQGEQPSYYHLKVA